MFTIQSACVYANYRQVFVCVCSRPSALYCVYVAFEAELACLSMFVCHCLSACLYAFVYPLLPVSLGTCPSVSTCLCLPVGPSVCPTVHPTVRPSVCLSVRPSVCLSVCLCVHRAVYSCCSSVRVSTTPDRVFVRNHPALWSHWPRYVHVSVF